MKALTQTVVFLAVWIGGATVFDAWLGWTGSWLMLGGAITAIIAGNASGIVSIK